MSVCMENLLLTGCGGGQLYALQQTECAANPNANNPQKLQHLANARGSLNVTGRQDGKFQTKTSVSRYSLAVALRTYISWLLL